MEEKYKEIAELFDYNPETGIFTHKPREDKSFNTKFAGKEAGSLEKCSGYIVMQVRSTKYYAHILAFYITHGYIPKEVDHDNRIRHDNRAINLLASDRFSNGKNVGAHKDNKLGIKNIHQKASGSYQVQIARKGVKHTKTFKELENAIEWRDAKLLELDSL
ncbi:phage-associated homing endonuclease [Yersinia phage phiR2-01]|uniref:Phage-associated homing endonuclease n=1 Tax=Yersinia phage phiR2-01 TaxID=1206557 RepID=I7LH06_9CAUD|nr:phage-associated homing endonuclease [Yersinia phage phiR2-01]CCI88514.1 phage-associated homing endonuclease [Yersinia phage phiR2-01]